ncbi:MAG: YbaN family protein [Methyloligellaceae bacterium]
MSVPPASTGPLRLAYLAIGWASFGTGVLGAFLPVLPTTPFMIIALWAFSKSSQRLRHWLYNHTLFGPPLRRWHEHRVIPPSAKLASLGAMTLSLGYLVIFTSTPLPYLLATALLMVVGALYIVTKPSHAPGRGPQERQS